MSGGLVLPAQYRPLVSGLEFIHWRETGSEKVDNHPITWIDSVIGEVTLVKNTLDRILPWKPDDGGLYRHRPLYLGELLIQGAVGLARRIDSVTIDSYLVGFNDQDPERGKHSVEIHTRHGGLDALTAYTVDVALDRPQGESSETECSRVDTRQNPFYRNIVHNELDVLSGILSRKVQ